MSVRHHRLVPAVVTVALGTLIAVQSRVNGELARHVGTGLFPAWWTMLTGLIVLAVGVSAHRRSRTGLVTVVAAVRGRALPWWTLLGGLFGGLFLVVQSVTVPLVGVAVFSVGIVAGQTTGSLLVDRLGISASGKVHVTVNRVVASVLAVGAVLVAISDRLGTSGGTLAYAVLAFLAGAVIAPQQAANGRVGVVARSPFTAAFVNFAGGVIVLTCVLLLALELGGLDVADPWGAPAWAYLGGILGLSVIAGAAWVVPTLGLLVFSLLSVLGQLSGSLALDVLAPTPGTNVGWHLVLAVGMTFGAVLIATGRGRRR
jgi:bacterial/archaeal transporter family-2 protein